jgi:hypothetical protein
MCWSFLVLGRERFPSGALLRVLDTYAVYHSVDIHTLSQLWEIALVVIPPSHTNKLQPLDRQNGEDVISDILRIKGEDLRNAVMFFDGLTVARPEPTQSLREAL